MSSQGVPKFQYLEYTGTTCGVPTASGRLPTSRPQKCIYRDKLFTTQNHEEISQDRPRCWPFQGKHRAFYELLSNFGLVRAEAPVRKIPLRDYGETNTK